MDEWISGDEAAAILGVSRSTVYRSLTDPDERKSRWGDENIGWRLKPLVRRRVYQVSRRRTSELADGNTSTTH